MNFYFQLIIKSWKNYENLDFSTSGLCLAFKKFFGLFSIFLAFRYLEYSKSFKFELFWSNFAIKTIFAENLAKWISVNCWNNLTTIYDKCQKNQIKNIDRIVGPFLSQIQFCQFMAKNFDWADIFVHLQAIWKYFLLR